MYFSKEMYFIMFYRPDDKSVCADIIPYYESGKFYLFYLKDFRDFEKHGEGCPWCLLETENLVDYKEYGEVLPRGTIEKQDLYVFTGCCVKFNGEYNIFYTGHNPHLRAKGLPEQKILRAKSKDIIHWEKDDDFVFPAPEWLEMHDFRDPFVYYDENLKKYCMLIAGRLKNDNPVNSKGLTLIAYSDDLNNWEVSKTPFYSPDAFFTHECPDLFKMGDWWYLVFSEFTDKVSTVYRMSKSINGPWITPVNDTFDNHMWYAAKSVSDGKHRYIFGWNRIKNFEVDHEFTQWGGNIIPHEIIQKDDGTLCVKCPETIADIYKKEISVKQRFSLNANYNDGVYMVGENGKKGVVVLNDLPDKCKIEAEFTTVDLMGNFGFMLRASEQADEYYSVKFEPKHNRLAMDKWPRRDASFSFDANTERYCPIVACKKNKILIIMEGSVLEVYVNFEIAMSARIFDIKKGKLALFAQDTVVKFENVKIFE